MTSFPPVAADGIMVARQPVAWNSGTDNRPLRCVRDVAAPGAGVRSPGLGAARVMARAPTKKMFMRLVQQFRCVPTAPLGRPVVPEV